jgi:hypothetical protein
LCNPIFLTAASLAIGTASAVTGYMGQSRMADQNAEEARRAAVTNYAYTQNRISQERAAAIGQKTETAIEAMKARSTAKVAAGEAGVVGLSVDHLMNDFAGRQGRYNDSVDTNFQMQRDYLVGEMEGQRAQAQRQINSVPKPSFLDTSLRILGVGASAATGYYNMTAKKV